MISVRTITAKANNNNTFTTVDGDQSIVVAVNSFIADRYNCPTVRWGGSGGTYMTLIAYAWNGGGTVMCGLWHLSRPAIGTYQLYCSHSSCTGQIVAFIQKSVVDLVSHTGTNSHNKNDYLEVSTTSRECDTVFYAGIKYTSDGAWITGESSSDIVGGMRMAYEAGAASCAATYGSAGDSQLALVAGSIHFFGGGFLPDSLRLLNGSLTFFKKAKAAVLPTVMYASPVTFTQPYAPTAAAGSAEAGARVRLGDGSIPKDGEVIVRTNTETKKVYVKKGVVVPPPKRRIPGRI